MQSLSYDEFVYSYRSGDIFVAIDGNKAGDFVMSDFADKHNKPAHLFWTWVGILLVVPVPVVLLFVYWLYAIAAFVAGLMVVSAARKSDREFVLNNMLDDRTFFEYVRLHGGATVTDKTGQII